MTYAGESKHPRKWVTRNKHGILEVMLSEENIVTLVFTHHNINIAEYRTRVVLPYIRGDKNERT